MALGQVQPGVDLLAEVLRTEDLQPSLEREVHRRGHRELQVVAFRLVENRQRMPAMLAVVDADVAAGLHGKFPLRLVIAPSAAGEVAQDGFEPQQVVVEHRVCDRQRVTFVELAVDAVGVGAEALNPGQRDHHFSGDRETEDLVLALREAVHVRDNNRISHDAKSFYWRFRNGLFSGGSEAVEGPTYAS